jgi:hypothetical protein
MPPDLWMIEEVEEEVQSCLVSRNHFCAEPEGKGLLQFLVLPQTIKKHRLDAV